MNLTKLTGQSLKLRSYNKTVNFLFRLNENLAHVHKNVYNQYQAYFSTQRSIGENRPGDEANKVGFFGRRHLPPEYHPILLNLSYFHSSLGYAKHFPLPPSNGVFLFQCTMNVYIYNFYYDKYIRIYWICFIDAILDMQTCVQYNNCSSQQTVHMYLLICYNSHSYIVSFEVLAIHVLFSNNSTRKVIIQNKSISCCSTHFLYLHILTTIEKRQSQYYNDINIVQLQKNVNSPKWFHISEKNHAHHTR